MMLNSTSPDQSTSQHFFFVLMPHGNTTDFKEFGD